MRGRYGVEGGGILGGQRGRLVTRREWRIPELEFLVET